MKRSGIIRCQAVEFTTLTGALVIMEANLYIIYLMIKHKREQEYEHIQDAKDEDDRDKTPYPAIERSNRMS